MTASRLTGSGLIVFAVLMNVPFALLAGGFDYPDILRRPPAEIFARFLDGGTPLILTWWLYMLVAVLFVPVALASPLILRGRPGWLVSAAITFGVTAGVLQAIGLSRWVFVVPGLAAAASDASATESQRQAAALVFTTLHQFAGVAIGEHLGQTFTALFAATMGLAQLGSGRPMQGSLGIAAALAIAGGLVEGFATVIRFDPGAFGVLTPVGFLIFSAWLAASGVGLLRQPAATSDVRPAHG